MTKLGAVRAAEARTVPDYRQAVVSALEGVPGVSAGASVPDVPVEGAAWPTWVQTTYATGPLDVPGRPTYDVYVLLPAGYAPETVESGEGFLADVVAALWPVAAVDYAEPVSVRFDNNTTMPGLRLRARMRGISQ